MEGILAHALSLPTCCNFIAKNNTKYTPRRVGKFRHISDAPRIIHHTEKCPHARRKGKGKAAWVGGEAPILRQRYRAVEQFMRAPSTLRRSGERRPQLPRRLAQPDLNNMRSTIALPRSLWLSFQFLCTMSPSGAPG